MSDQFFELTSPRDMLLKAEREYARLTQELVIDNIFNFFVTVYHIRDYVRECSQVKQKDLDRLLATPEIKMCRFICHKGKHLKLTEMPNWPTKVRRMQPAIPGAFRPGQSVPAGGGVKRFYVNGKEIDVRTLARSALASWTAFFAQHNIP